VRRTGRLLPVDRDVTCLCNIWDDPISCGPFSSPRIRPCSVFALDKGLLSHLLAPRGRQSGLLALLTSHLGEYQLFACARDSASFLCYGVLFLGRHPSVPSTPKTEVSTYPPPPTVHFPFCRNFRLCIRQLVWFDRPPGPALPQLLSLRVRGSPRPACLLGFLLTKF